MTRVTLQSATDSQTVGLGDGVPKPMLEILWMASEWDPKSEYAMAQLPPTYLQLQVGS